MRRRPQWREAAPAPPAPATARPRPCSRELDFVNWVHEAVLPEPVGHEVGSDAFPTRAPEILTRPLRAPSGSRMERAERARDTVRKCGENGLGSASPCIARATMDACPH